MQKEEFQVPGLIQAYSLICILNPPKLSKTGTYLKFIDKIIHGNLLTNENIPCL